MEQEKTYLNLIEFSLANDPRTPREGRLTSTPNVELAVPIDYSLADCYTYYQKYRERLDYDAVSDSIKRTNIGRIKVSDIITLFPHLTLDENYDLWCYIAKDNYDGGRMGRAVAVPVGGNLVASAEPVFLSTALTLPVEAAPPMEAVYHDGTPEGYLEAILCTYLLKRLSVTNRRDEKLINRQPPDLSNNYHESHRILDWRLWFCPPADENGQGAVFAVRRHFRYFFVNHGRDENSFYADRYSFVQRLDRMHDIDGYELKDDGDLGHVKVNCLLPGNRYDARRRCCVYIRSSSWIAFSK